MKTFFIVLILISSALAAIFMNIESPQEKIQKNVSEKESSTLQARINQNLSLMRRITKEADIKQSYLFKLNSDFLMQALEGKPFLSKEFIGEYEELNNIVNQTAQSIQTNTPHLYQDIHIMEAHIEKFDKKIKSIGLSELKINWYAMQKSYRQFLREPNVHELKNYQSKLIQTKKIITELYLDDEDETYLFEFLARHNDVFTSFDIVYKDVGLQRIHKLKPLMYALKEEMQLNPSLFKEPLL